MDASFGSEPGPPRITCILLSTCRRAAQQGQDLFKASLDQTVQGLWFSEDPCQDRVPARRLHALVGALQRRGGHTSEPAFPVTRLLAQGPEH